MKLRTGPFQERRDYLHDDVDYDDPLAEARSPWFWIGAVVFALGFWAFVALMLAIVPGPS